MTHPSAGGELKVGDLNVVAQPLATAALGFGDLSSLAPQVPNAGIATGTIAQFWKELADTMAGISKITAGIADAVQTSGHAYTHTDSSNSHEIQHSSAVIADGSVTGEGGR